VRRLDPEQYLMLICSTDDLVKNVSMDYLITHVIISSVYVYEFALVFLHSVRIVLAHKTRKK
jgi:hypothetical protein